MACIVAGSIFLITAILVLITLSGLTDIFEWILYELTPLFEGILQISDPVVSLIPFGLSSRTLILFVLIIGGIGLFLIGFYILINTQSGLFYTRKGTPTRSRFTSFREVMTRGTEPLGGHPSWPESSDPRSQQVFMTHLSRVSTVGPEAHLPMSAHRPPLVSPVRKGNPAGYNAVSLAKSRENSRAQDYSVGECLQAGSGTDTDQTCGQESLLEPALTGKFSAPRPLIQIVFAADSKSQLAVKPSLRNS